MKFSIIVPVWNNEEWLDKCFKSILNQTYKDYEVIIVDDMSTDNGMEIINKYQKLFNHCKVIKNKTRRLNGGSRNVGIAESTGEYILFMDCDDWLYNDKVLEDIANKLNGEDIMFLSYTCKTKESYIDLRVHYNNLKEAFKNMLCAPWLKCVKTELMKDTLFPEGTLFEDRIQHYRLLLKAKTFTNLDQISYVWNRMNTHTISDSDEYKYYRFNYCGELYRLIKDIENLELKEFVIKELKEYMSSCESMVNEL